MDCLKERGKKPGIFQHGYFTLDSRKTVEIINFHVFFWGVKQLCSVPCLRRKPLSRLINSFRALFRERAKETYLPTTWGREEASISSIIEPFSIHVLNSNKLCRDNVATWGLLHRSPPCSTFSSNFIHLQEGRAMRLLKLLLPPILADWSGRSNTAEISQLTDKFKRTHFPTHP